MHRIPNDYSCAQLFELKKKIKEISKIVAEALFPAGFGTILGRSLS